VNLGLMLEEILTLSNFMEEQTSGTLGDKKKRALERRVVFHIRGHSVMNQEESLALCLFLPL